MAGEPLADQFEANIDVVYKHSRHEAIVGIDVGSYEADFLVEEHHASGVACPRAKRFGEFRRIDTEDPDSDYRAAALEPDVERVAVTY